MKLSTIIILLLLAIGVEAFIIFEPRIKFTHVSVEE